jgi:hypothetical protein
MTLIRILLANLLRNEKDEVAAALAHELLASNDRWNPVPR